MTGQNEKENLRKEIESSQKKFDLEFDKRNNKLSYIVRDQRILTRQKETINKWRKDMLHADMKAISNAIAMAKGKEKDPEPPTINSDQVLSELIAERDNLKRTLNEKLALAKKNEARLNELPNLIAQQLVSICTVQIKKTRLFLTSPLEMLLLFYRQRTIHWPGTLVSR